MPATAAAHFTVTWVSEWVSSFLTAHFTVTSVLGSLTQSLFINVSVIASRCSLVSAATVRLLLQCPPRSHRSCIRRRCSCSCHRQSVAYEYWRWTDYTACATEAGITRTWSSVSFAATGTILLTSRQICRVSATRRGKCCRKPKPTKQVTV